MSNFVMRFVVVFCTCISLTVCRDDNELLSVFVVFRHGHRTPLKTYPTDPCNNTWTYPLGELTDEGRRQVFELGTWLREYYHNFIPNEYSAKDVYTQTSGYNRCKESAEKVILGLYSKNLSRNIENENFLHGVQMHTPPLNEDDVIYIGRPCPNYGKLLERALSESPFVEFESSNEKVYKYLSKNMGTNITTFVDLQYLPDLLELQLGNNCTLPQWTQRVFPETLQKLAAFNLILETFNRDISSLRVGNLLNEVLANFQKIVLTNDTTNVSKVIKGSSGKKLVLFSGHDTTIAAILNSLKLYNIHWPPFAAAILFELRRNKETFLVNMIYRKSGELVELKLKDNEFNCSFQEFHRIVGDIALNATQYETKCHET